MQRFSASIFDAITGTTGNDSLDGTAGKDVIHGLEGNDTVHAGAGNDRIFGEDGDDRLSGEDGNDTINSGDGDDFLFGGAGDDLLTGGNAIFFEELYGGDGNDRLIAGTCDLGVALDGGAGNDILDGRQGLASASYGSATSGVSVSLGIKGAQDTGSAGMDTLISIERLFGSSSDDTLTAGKQGAYLGGSWGDDMLVGAKGGDTLDGGRGADTMTGGGGVDTFAFNWWLPGEFDTDLITDLSNKDVIDLVHLNGGRFEIVKKFSGESNQAMLTYDNHDKVTHLSFDFDGDKAVDMVIDIAGDHHTFDNFVS